MMHMYPLLAKGLSSQICSSWKTVQFYLLFLAYSKGLDLRHITIFTFPLKDVSYPVQIF